MTTKEYEAAIETARNVLLPGIGMLETAFEEMKEELVNEQRIKMTETFLNTLLLVAHTEQGKRLFIKILEFSKEIDVEITHKYWNLYDDIENLVKNRYFNITTK
jgi:imidazoleglycerol phosphate synthase glutamine amidotransferase subunit HisH